MEKTYSFKKIEKKWQENWHKNNSFAVKEDTSKPKYYVLEMFPYPSGQIHMGHVRNYSIGDVVARYKKAKGFNVLHPMGWDAFGLPAENAARENNINPSIWTLQNIEIMKEQLKALGLSLDWNRELATCSPSYYKDEQIAFIEFFKKGLAYKKESWVNWDPVEQTTLANEQVIDGKGWRSGALVEQKKLNQWFLKITAFADDLLKGLDSLKNWPEKVKHMQFNWIGKSQGSIINFKVKGQDITIPIYTTRGDTIFGSSFLALSINHDLSIKLAKENSDINNFIIKHQKNLTIEEKEGIDTSLVAINPISNEEIKIFIANYVLDYGAGAVFGCPAHDARDFEFAKKYNLPIITVISPKKDQNWLVEDEAFEEEGFIINSKFLNGLSTKEAKEKVIEFLEEHNLGERKTNFKLKDWGVSRQRYWGCPIPIIHCEECGIVPEKIENLPVVLPDDVDFNISGNPLEHHPTWKYTKCPKCNNNAIRETDTFDTFFESSWYFLRYASMPKDDAFAKEDINYWLPVDQYIGGIEHAVMHLLYARFFTRALSHIDFIESLQEPFNNLLTQGMICHITYKNESGKWVFPNDVISKDNELIDKISGEKVITGRIEKMSKSKKNVVNPNEICQIYGADTARLFVLSDSPPVKDLQWTHQGIEGSYKFVRKLWNLAITYCDIPTKDFDIQNATDVERKFYTDIQKFIYKIENNINEFHLNKAIALNRELFNLIDKNKDELNDSIIKYGILSLIQLLNPFIPHITEELWQLLGEKIPLTETPWISYNPKYLQEETITVAIQILGKTRGTIEVSPDISKVDLLQEVQQITKIKNYIQDKDIKKVIYVPKKIINIII